MTIGVGIELGIHADLDPPLDWQQPCPGRVLVCGQVGVNWEFECERCGHEWARPASKVDPGAFTAQRVDRRRSSSEIPTDLRGLPRPENDSGPSGAASAWAAGKLRGLTLTGSVGVGKSYLAARAAWWRMEHEALRWLSVPVLFARLGASFSDEGRQDALRVLVGTTALVLDDIDKTRPTEYAAEQLFCAIDARVTEGAGLLVTTNLVLSVLAERFPEPYGEAIGSRLAGYCETFAMIGPDRRLARFAA
jgi:IstB-like ATP binding protein